jgi:hypothetical protein
MRMGERVSAAGLHRGLGISKLTLAGYLILQTRFLLKPLKQDGSAA